MNEVAIKIRRDCSPTEWNLYLPDAFQMMTVPNIRKVFKEMFRSHWVNESAIETLDTYFPIWVEECKQEVKDRKKDKAEKYVTSKRLGPVQRMDNLRLVQIVKEAERALKWIEKVQTIYQEIRKDHYYV